MKINNMHNSFNDIALKAGQLLEYIANYDAPGFSAVITHEEAEELAGRLINDAINRLMNKENLDGVMINDLLTEIRNK